MRIVLDGPKVFLVGSSGCHYAELEAYIAHAGHTPQAWLKDLGTSLLATELLVEAGGRVCYDSWTKRRPGGTEAYLTHILECGHGRVLEHAVYSFILTDLSRAASHELYTHCVGFSKSMRSTRYVDESDAAFVCPPDLVAGAKEYDAKFGTVQWVDLRKDLPQAYMDWKEACEHSLQNYTQLVKRLTGEFATADVCFTCGVDLREKYLHQTPNLRPHRYCPICRAYSPLQNTTEVRKRARQTARYVFPHSLATTIFGTVNARALRHFFEMRASSHADTEIRQLAHRMWQKVVAASPLLFQDYQEEILPDGTVALSTPHRKV